MAIVGGLDVHRRQITYDWIDTTTGEACRGQLSPASRVELRDWLAQFDGHQAAFALEATSAAPLVFADASSPPSLSLERPSLSHSPPAN